MLAPNHPCLRDSKNLSISHSEILKGKGLHMKVGLVTQDGAFTPPTQHWRFCQSKESYKETQGYREPMHKRLHKSRSIIIIAFSDILLSL